MQFESFHWLSHLGIWAIIIHHIFLLGRDWFKRVTRLNIPQLKLGNIRVIFSNFQNSACCEKHLKDNKHNSPHLARKYTRIFVLGHHLFLKVHSFPRALPSENCSLLGTDSVRGQTFENISAPNGSCCLFIPYSTNMVSIRVMFGVFLSLSFSISGMLDMIWFV